MTEFSEYSILLRYSFSLSISRVFTQCTVARSNLISANRKWIDAYSMGVTRAGDP